MRARIKKAEWIYRGKVFSVRRDVVVEPGWQRGGRIEAVREVVRHTGSVVLLPVFPDGRILLVRQYRYAVGEFLWELPAGRIEPGESPWAAAQRELLEETGYTAKRFIRLLKLFPTPGFVSEVMFFYIVRGLRAGQAQPDPDEALAGKKFTLSELWQMIRRGRLCDGKSVAGILYYARLSKRR